VDRSGRTSDPDIFAAGDCATTFSLLDGRETWSPMGSTANKQARVAALALTSADAEFPGVLGTMIVRAFGFSAAKTGLGEREAKEAGIHAICVTVPADDRAHYHPGSEKLALKLLAAADTGEIIGCQAYGMGAADKPLDAVAVAMSLGATVDSLADVDFAYAPPFSTAINPVNLACHVLQNKMSGRMESVGCVRAKEMISSEGWDGLLLDPRDEAEFRTGSIKGAVNIQMQDFPARLHEIERYKDRDVLIVCNYGKRAYESYIRLKHCGFTRAKVLEGGTKFWPFGLE